MSKICDRVYGTTTIMTVKVIDGIETCPACGKPVICHGKPIEQRALYWSLSGDTGISSEAICAHMTGYVPKRPHPPSDASDRGRCIRLLELIPEWLPRLNEMLQYDHSNARDTIVISASGISADRNTWARQIPLIADEGGFRR